MKPKYLTKNEYTDFLKKATTEHQTIEGEERDKIWKILQQLEPISSTNNQRMFTDVYEFNGLRYNVYHGLEANPVIELITQESLE